MENMYRTVFAVAALFCALHLFAAPAKPKLPEQYKKWLDEDVVYIITDGERKEFLALTTDQEREKFIDSFWAIRNPKHNSEHNAYRDEHYERIAYVNSHFGKESNTPGWMTDRGRAWILFGKPTSQHPFIGYGQIYPFELWMYENPIDTPNLPRFFYLLFYSDGGTAEMKFYRPFLDGPLKLVRGSSFNTNKDVYKYMQQLGGDVGHAILSLVPSEPVDTVNYTPDLSSDMLIGRIQNMANDPFNVKKLNEERSLHAKVTSYFTVDQNLPLAVSSLQLTDPTGKAWIDYGVLIDDVKLGVRDGARLKLNISYRLTTKDGDTVLEDGEEHTWPAFADATPDAKFAPFVLADRLPVEPGSYKLEIEIANHATQQNFRGSLDVNALPATDISFSDPLVTTSVDRVARPSAVQPFQYFGVQFHPSPRREVNHPEPLRLLFELHEKAGAADDYQMDYVFANVEDKADRRTLTEDVPQSEFKDGRLLKSKSIAVNDLNNGDYRLVINVRRKGSPQVLASSNTPLRVSAEKAEVPLYFLSGAPALAKPGIAAYMRALEAISQKNDSAATQYFSEALNQNPANTFAGQSLIQLYFAQRKYAPISDLFKRLGIASFNTSPVTLAQIALSLRQNGDSVQARSVISAGLGLFPGNPTLSALQTRAQ